MPGIKKSRFLVMPNLIISSLFFLDVFPVTVELVDGALESYMATHRVLIESGDPVAMLNQRRPFSINSNENLVIDGSRSFDPDGEEDMTYQWSCARVGYFDYY